MKNGVAVNGHAVSTQRPTRANWLSPGAGQSLGAAQPSQPRGPFGGVNQTPAQTSPVTSKTVTLSPGWKTRAVRPALCWSGSTIPLLVA